MSKNWSAEYTVKKGDVTLQVYRRCKTKPAAGARLPVVFLVHGSSFGALAGYDLQVEDDIRRFFYLPLQHSEDRADQDRQVELFQTRMERKPDDRWAEHHHDVIVRFGRFPHRNRALGRETTPEERAFLDEDGFRG